MRSLMLTSYLILISLSLSAQIDAKLNLGSAITGGLGVAADFGLNENSSLSAGLGFATNTLDVNLGSGSREYSYGRFRIIPEYRYYFSPPTFADGVFIGGYGKLVFISASSVEDPETYKATRGVLGALVGYKWVAPSGFVFELNLGGGGGLILNDSADDAVARAVINAFAKLDLRLGIIAGYRF